MWNDIETTNDYLHFSVVSGTVADLIIESGDNPISIGVSGNWGSGKSSMVKMIGKELEKKDDGKQKYLFLEFNAWLYQGYDDAKAALLQAVTKKLSDEMKKRKINESTEESDKNCGIVLRNSLNEWTGSRFQNSLYLFWLDWFLGLCLLVHLQRYFSQLRIVLRIKKIRMKMPKLFLRA